MWESPVSARCGPLQRLGGFTKEERTGMLYGTALFLKAAVRPLYFQVQDRFHRASTWWASTTSGDKGACVSWMWPLWNFYPISCPSKTQLLQLHILFLITQLGEFPYGKLYYSHLFLLPIRPLSGKILGPLWQKWRKAMRLLWSIKMLVGVSVIPQASVFSMNFKAKQACIKLQLILEKTTSKKRILQSQTSRSL